MVVDFFFKKKKRWRKEEKKKVWFSSDSEACIYFSLKLHFCLFYFLYFLVFCDLLETKKRGKGGDKNLFCLLLQFSLFCCIFIIVNSFWKHSVRVCTPWMLFRKRVSSTAIGFSWRNFEWTWCCVHHCRMVNKIKPWWPGMVNLCQIFSYPHTRCRALFRSCPVYSILF